MIPSSMHWLFWDLEPASVDVEQHFPTIVARILERGRLDDVHWALRTYGEERIHAFLRDVGHVELTPRTIALWRAYFHAGDEPWQDPSAWRRASSAPWID